MNIHEYQAKELLAKFGVPVPAGHAAMSVEEAVKAAEQLPGPLWVVKAQIHAGGRGKGKFKELGPDAKGGVRLARSIEEVRANAEEMLGKTLVTIQTGEHGKQVNRLYITDGVDIEKEFYLALLVDRGSSRIAVVASTEGGMDIEAVAHDTPEKIETITIDPATGLMPHHGRAVAAALGLSGDLAKQASNVLAKLYDAFIGTDASQIEINPLAITDGGKLMVLDAKVGFDNNAEFRHPDLERAATVDQIPPHAVTGASELLRDPRLQPLQVPASRPAGADGGVLGLRVHVRLARALVRPPGVRRRGGHGPQLHPVWSRTVQHRGRGGLRGPARRGQGPQAPRHEPPLRDGQGRHRPQEHRVDCTLRNIHGLQR